MKILTFIFLMIFILQSLSSTLFPHIIWLYWDSGQQTLSMFSRACLERIRSLHQGTDWETRMVDKYSINKWLDKNQFDQLNQIFHGSVQLSIQSKVDFYRLFFLRKYGGVWLDVTMILHQNLNWLDHLKQNPFVLNKDFSQQPQFFYFYINRQSLGKVNVNYKQYDIYTKLDGENSFLAAQKQSRFVRDLIKQFKNLVLLGKRQFFSVAQDVNLPFEYRPYWMAYLATAITQYKKDKAFRAIINTNRHIPLNNFYKIWAISRGIGLYHQTQSPDINLIFQNEPRKGDFSRYMTKIHHFGAYQMMQNILSGSQVKIQHQSQNLNPEIFNFGKQNLPYSYRCLYQLQIDQHSSINKYLLSKIDRIKYFQNASVIKDSEIPFVCRVTNLSQLKDIMETVWLWIQNSFWIYLIIQIFTEYFYFFRISEQIQTKINLSKNQLKTLIFQKILIFIFIQGQVNLIHSQYSLWLHGSPTSKFVGAIISSMALIVFCDIGSLKTKIFSFKINICILVTIMIIFQYFLEYSNTIWKYQGVVYNFQTIKKLNWQKLLECQLEIAKILTVTIIVSSLQKLSQRLGICQLWEKIYILQQFNQSKQQKQEEKQNKI